MGGGQSKLDQLVSTLKPGDLIEIPGKLSHWAVYVGKRLLAGNNVETHCVVHVKLGSISSSISTVDTNTASKYSAPRLPNGPVPGRVLKRLAHNATVKLEPIDALPNFENAVVNNGADADMSVKARNQIVQDAMKEIDHPYKFHAVTNNCEHFANMCRYGRKRSAQADQAVIQNIEALEKMVVDDAALNDRLSVIKQVMTAKEAEMRDQEMRKNCLIIFGLQDSNSTFADKMAVKQLLAELKLQEKIVVDRDIEEIVRLGKEYSPGKKIRALRLRLKSMDHREMILKTSSRLKNSDDFRRVSINPDKTKKQLEQHKKLLTIFGTATQYRARVDVV